ncbi:hypothetical protein [Streptomyces ardesiacus]
MRQTIKHSKARAMTHPDNRGREVRKYYGQGRDWRFTRGAVVVKRND